MDQIYDFEQHSSPILNENILRAKLEKQKLRRQTALVAVAGILLQIVMLLFGLISFEVYPLIALVCMGYVVLAATGGSVVALVFVKKGGKIYG